MRGCYDARPDPKFHKFSTSYNRKGFVMLKRWMVGVGCLTLALSYSTIAQAGINEDLLIGAAGSGNVKEVSRLLADGADVNAKDKDGRTPLISAISKGHGAVAEVLRQHGGK